MGVPERDSLKLDLAAGLCQRAGVGPVEHGGLLAQKLGDPLSRGRGGVDGGAELPEPPNGTVEAAEVGQKDEQGTEGEPSVREPPDAERDDREAARDLNQRNHGRHQRLCPRRRHRRLELPEVLALKPVDLSLLAVVGLHQLGVGEAFLSDRADRTAPAPCLTGGVPNHPREPEGHEPEEGSDDQRHQRELPLNVKEGAREVDDARDVGDHVPDAREDKALDRRHVVGEPGDHVTQRSPLEEIEREAVEMTKQPAAKRQDEPPSDPGRQVGIADGDGPGHERQSGVAEGDPPERPEIARDEHPIHDDLEQPDPGRLDGRRQDDEGKGQPDEPAVRPGIGPEASEDFAQG